MKVHFIAIGGSAMHNLAIALHKKGYQVSGSDDEIFDPARKRLLQYGLLPEKFGWFPDKINHSIDEVILGMHARADNPELLKAKDLGLRIFSYPEYLFEQSKDKTRVVIGGSHGKTTITAMILHVLHYHSIKADYMVGAQLDGFEVMVKLTNNASFMVIEGDEYLSSPIDPRPKFHIYKPHIALLSGIAWDHINVFPSLDNYVDQFRRFIHCIEPDGKLVYCVEDDLVKTIVEEEASENLCLYPYSLPAYTIAGNKTIIHEDGANHGIQVFGRHNLLNMNGAKIICQQLGVTASMFFEAITTFKGASRRLERIYEKPSLTVYRDFAHAPSKIRASSDAVKEFHPGKQLIACVELHTYSSLSKDFLIQYKGTLDSADKAFIFYDPHALALKKLPDIYPDDILQAFDKPGAMVFNNKEDLLKAVKQELNKPACLLLMSSGNFGGLDVNTLFE